MVRAYCHKVVKLSDALQTYAPEKEATTNVHGVRSDFLNEGLRRAEQLNMRPADDKSSGRRDDSILHRQAAMGERLGHYVGNGRLLQTNHW